jgi:hypothetical protein
MAQRERKKTTPQAKRHKRQQRWGGRKEKWESLFDDILRTVREQLHSDTLSREPFDIFQKYMRDLHESGDLSEAVRIDKLLLARYRAELKDLDAWMPYTKHRGPERDRVKAVVKELEKFLRKGIRELEGTIADFQRDINDEQGVPRLPTAAEEAAIEAEVMERKKEKKKKIRKGKKSQVEKPFYLEGLKCTFLVYDPDVQPLGKNSPGWKNLYTWLNFFKDRLLSLCLELHRAIARDRKNSIPKIMKNVTLLLEQKSGHFEGLLEKGVIGSLPAMLILRPPMSNQTADLQRYMHHLVKCFLAFFYNIFNDDIVIDERTWVGKVIEKCDISKSADSYPEERLSPLASLDGLDILRRLYDEFDEETGDLTLADAAAVAPEAPDLEQKHEVFDTEVPLAPVEIPPDIGMAEEIPDDYVASPVHLADDDTKQMSGPTNTIEIDADASKQVASDNGMEEDLMVDQAIANRLRGRPNYTEKLNLAALQTLKKKGPIGVPDQAWPGSVDQKEESEIREEVLDKIATQLEAVHKLLDKVGPASPPISDDVLDDLEDQAFAAYDSVDEDKSGLDLKHGNMKLQKDEIQDAPYPEIVEAMDETAEKGWLRMFSTLKPLTELDYAVRVDSLIAWFKRYFKGPKATDNEVARIMLDLIEARYAYARVRPEATANQLEQEDPGETRRLYLILMNGLWTKLRKLGFAGILRDMVPREPVLPAAQPQKSNKRKRAPAHSR